MNYKWTFFTISLYVLLACNGNKDESVIKKNAGQQLLHIAEEKVSLMQYDSAIVYLRQALTQGIEEPMLIVRNSNLYALIDSSKYRPEIRLLLEEFAVENRAKMTRENEPGEPIIVEAIIVDESNNAPLSNVRVEVVHTDKDGFYFREKSMWNPRIFAYLISSDKGEFEVNTTKPGTYKDDDGKYVPAHIHFTLKKDSFRLYGGEFTFEDDSIYMENGNNDEILVAKLMNTRSPKKYQVIIPMQRE